MAWWQRVWLLPVLCSAAWFCTLFPLLIAWLAEGRPRYPDQSNPYVAFISDIGAFRLQPLFVTGCTITGLTYAPTLLFIHIARYDTRMYGKNPSEESPEPWHKKFLSLLGVAGGLLAGACLILLSLFDTYDHHVLHRKLLMSTFVGLGGSAVCTVAVYMLNPFTRGRDEVVRSRPFCTFCSLTVIVEVGLSIVFLACQFTDHMRIAGIFEWVITFLGVGYLLTLIGFVLPPSENIKTSETAPLLQSQ